MWVWVSGVWVRGPVLLPVRRDTRGGGAEGIFRMAHTVAWRCGYGVEW